jgi:hypothetical protein
MLQTFVSHVITSARIIRDEKGSELPDLTRARAKAVEYACVLIGDAALLGQDVSSRAMAI